MYSLSMLFVLLLLRITSIRSDDSIIRIEEKLTTDRDFYDDWTRLVTKQGDLLSEQTFDFPLDSVLKDLQECPVTVPAIPAETTSEVKPSDISMLAHVGHLSTYCKTNASLLLSGVLDSCKHHSSTMELPNFGSMLKRWNPGLIEIDSNDRDDLLVQQARNIADSMKQIEGYEDVWKVIVIYPSIQDGEASETGQTAVEVLDTLEELERLLPQKTFIIVLRSSGNGIWKDASHAEKACHEMLSRWKMRDKFNSNSVWDQVELISQKNFQKPNFTVEILPLLREARLVTLPHTADLSVLGYDCAHFSERGLSLLHLAMWNSLLTRSHARTHEYRPVVTRAICPDPVCPFLRTSENSAYCIWTEEKESTSTIAPQLLVLLGLFITVLLSLLVLLCLCRNSRTGDLLKPAKAFGASLSSIKFIDEEPV